jgi:flagellin
MRELAVQAASDTNQTRDREALQLEVNQLIDEIDQIASTTEFNEMQLLNGADVFGKSDGGTIQAGANADQTMKIFISAMTASGLGVTSAAINIKTHASATKALNLITAALNSVSMARATLGAYQNRLEYKIRNLDNAAENMAAAESRIRDADMAKMMTEFTKNNILFQASTAMLAQANALPQGVLQLLG